MATDVILRPNSAAHLVAVNAHEQELIAGLRQDKDYRAKLTLAQPRSVLQLRFYWATLDTAVENQDFYKSSKPLHIWLKSTLGMYDKVEFHDGKVHVELWSTGLDRMPADEFNGYFDKVLVLLCTEVCPSMDPRELVRHVEGQTGIKRDALRRPHPTMVGGPGAVGSKVA